MTINAIEFAWLAICIVGVVAALYALREAIVSRQVVRRWNGKAREINADAVVRREALRLVVQILLIAIAIPRALRVDDTVPTSGVLLAMTIPALLVVQSLLDLRANRRILAITEDQIDAERKEALSRIEAKGDRIVEALHENTALTAETHDKVISLTDHAEGA